MKRSPLTVTVLTDTHLYSLKNGFEGKAYDSKDIDVLATLPTYDEAIAKLMATMKEAAAGKLVRTLAALGEKLGSEGAAE